MSFNKYGTKLRLLGCFSSNCPSGETTTMEWTADKVYYLDGADYSDDPHCNKNRIWFEVHHPTYGLVDTFVDGIYCTERHWYEFYHATIEQGLTIKCKYQNNSESDVWFTGNLYLHVDKE